MNKRKLAALILGTISIVGACCSFYLLGLRRGRAEQAKIDAAKPPQHSSLEFGCIYADGHGNCETWQEYKQGWKDGCMAALPPSQAAKQYRCEPPAPKPSLQRPIAGDVAVTPPKPSKGSKPRPHETPFEVQFLKEGWTYQNLHVDLVNKKVTGVCPEKEAAKVSKPHLFRCEGCKDDMGLTEFYCLNGCRPAAAPKPQPAPKMCEMSQPGATLYWPARADGTCHREDWGDGSWKPELGQPEPWDCGDGRLTTAPCPASAKPQPEVPQ